MTEKSIKCNFLWEFKITGKKVRKINGFVHSVTCPSGAKF